MPALVRVVTAMRPDVLCVQEAPRFVNWRARRRALAEACGLRVAAGGRLGGVAVLTGPRAEVLRAESRVLRVFAGLEVRALALAVVEVDRARLAVGSIHLDLHAAARLRHVTEVLAFAERTATRAGAALVIGGDVNEQADRPAWRYLTGRLADCYQAAPKGDGLTFSSTKPRRRIDGLFAGPGPRLLSCGGVDAAQDDLTRASDHLPVIAEFRVGT
ncbi:endonuclease/exonuclease/phosphatase family protein [Nonomuraea sp. NPDC005983]|uniref:endonuclease/exonuclease/phosphatase family protein n=1 Tax=Nonomuraea sp. NPDC005983 TaxID=3155595 RepID=UPI0033BCE737